MVRDSSTVSWRHTCQTWCPRGHRPAPNSGHSPRACSGEPEATQSRWAQRKRDWLLLGTSRLATPAPASLRLPLNSIRRAPIGCGGFSSSPLQYGSPRSSAARPGNWPGLVSGRRWLASGCPLKWKLCRVGWKHTAAPHCEFGALTRKEDHLASRGDRVSGASIWPVPADATPAAVVPAPTGPGHGAAAELTGPSATGRNLVSPPGSLLQPFGCDSKRSVPAPTLGLLTKRLAPHPSQVGSRIAVRRQPVRIRSATEQRHPQRPRASAGSSVNATSRPIQQRCRHGKPFSSA